MRKYSHIGGLVDISLDEILSNLNFESFLKSLVIPENNYLLTFSGRSALSIIFENLNFNNGYVLLPEFICTDSIYPLLKKKNLVPLRFEIGKNFEQEIEKITFAIKKVNTKKIRAILFCNYFGIKDPINTAYEFKKLYPEIPIILDSVQDLSGLKLWEERSKWTDWQIYSFRKSLPIPDGGLLIGSGIGKTKLNITSKAINFSALQFQLSSIRNNFLFLENKNPNKIELEKEYIDLLKKIKKIPYNSIPITKFSEFLLSKINIEEVINLRNINFKYFSKEIKRFDFIELIENTRVNPESNFIPVFIKKYSRKKLQSFLKTRQIFCPIHWTQPRDIYKQASINGKYFSDNILSIPIDQRYTKNDMDRIIETINEYALIEK